MNYPGWFLAVGVLCLIAPPATAQDAKPVDVPGFWTADELRRIDQGLDVLNVTRKDLGFQKRPIEDPFRLPVVNRILDEPLAIGEVAAEWDAIAITGNAEALLLRAYEALDVAPRKSARVGLPWSTADWSSTISPDLATELREFFAREWDLGSAIGESLGSDTTERTKLLQKALLSQVEKPATAIDVPDMDDASFLVALQSVDRSRVSTQSSDLLSDVPRLIQILRKSLPAIPQDQPLYWGPDRDIVIYGLGDDRHPALEHGWLIIDLGGNDTYLSGAYASYLDVRPAVQVVIDLAGDDLYIGGNDFSFGGALGGVAIQWDCAGNDTYIAGNVSCGAGILGVGVLVDEGGNDTYRIKDFGQGAGAFGIGLLLEKGGHDFFHADLFGQGFASTWGCGMLVEMAGNDVYDAGGAHLHAPLWKDRFQSLSQGFSIGMRPDASGGVGVLVDVSGNDRYSADIYGQGASYWYSLGLLIDDDGHDTYALGQYGQGSGIHLSAGMLLDRKGQDSYYDANGVGMGGAHDYSVGFLVDREGDDYYAGGGGAQGGALTNSVAMLIDDAGDDSYAATRDGTQGSATAARNTGGIGLLLDGAGKDRYTETTRNDGVWAKDFVGAGIDEPTPADKPSVNAMAATISDADAERKVETDGKKDGAWDLDLLWKMVTLWEVGDNTVVMPKARDRFYALGKPALDRAFEKLDAKDSLVTRAIEKTLVEFAKTERAGVIERLVETSRDAEKQVRKNSVAMLSALKATEALPRLTEMLTGDPDNTGTVLAALAAMKTAPPEVAGLLLAPKESVGVQAAVCLGAVGDDDAIAALGLAMGSDFAFPVRLAATAQLAALGKRAVPALTSVLGRSDRMLRRNALRALGGTKDAGAWTVIRGALADGDPWVRLSALSAGDELIGAFDAETRQSFVVELQMAREAETDPVVKRLLASPAR